MAPDAGTVRLLRCVVREDLSMGMVDNLVADIRRVVEQLDKLFVFTDKEVSCCCPLLCFAESLLDSAVCKHVHYTS